LISRALVSQHHMPLNILIIKTSSLGDVLHGLAVVSDIKRNYPDSTIDWVVEETYQKTVALNLNINRVIPVAVRRWRKKITQKRTWEEISRSTKQIRTIQYDAVIDLQGLIKSALILKAAKGVKIGFDLGSAREPIASFFYDKKIFIRKDIHMLQRCRALVAKGLDYDQPASPVNYGIRQMGVSRRRDLAVILTGTAQQKKLWPESDWETVVRFLLSKGFECNFSWGNDEERQRCKRIISKTKGRLVPLQPIEKLAGLMATATIVIGVDTGLLHLAATQETPLVGIYGASDPKKTGPISMGEFRITGSIDGFPTPPEVVNAINELISQ
jgi:heptosyltransferase-1